MNEVRDEFFRLAREEQENVAKVILGGIIDRDAYARYCGKYDVYESLLELWKMAERAVMQKTIGDED